MKILMTTDNIGGVWTYSVLLAKELRRHGINVALAIIGNPLSEAQEKELATIPYYFMKSKQEWMPEPWTDVESAGEWLLNISRQLKPDIIHLNSYSLGSLPWNIPVVMTIHSCVLSWWQAVKKEEAPDEWYNYKNYVQNGLRSADVVVAPSCTMLESAQAFYKPLKKTQVIYNGGDNSHFYCSLKEDFVFSMGRLWDEAKNIALVIKAASKINYPVYIAGSTDGLKLPSLPENIHLLGQISRYEVSDWLSRAAIYLLPVVYEPFGYTFLEAAFSKCAIITGNIPTMKEIWGNTVLYADPSNSTKLADMVNALMEDKNLRYAKAEAAWRKALSNYNLEKMVNEYVALYQQQYDLFVQQPLKLQWQ